MILVVGDFMVDEYVHVAIERISPEAPVPVMRELRRDYRPGGAGNVAANIQSMGGEVSLKTVVGYTDNRWYDVAETYRWLGWISDNARTTTFKTRFIAERGQQVARLDCESAVGIPPFIESRLLENIILDGVKVLVLSDYQKGVITESLARKLIKMARDRKIPIIVDSKAKSYLHFEGATIITPNEMEWAQIRMYPDDITVMLTMGARGIKIINPVQTVVIPAIERHAVADVTGAGDTVVAALAVWIAEHGIGDLEGAARFANHAASIAVTKRGTYAVTRKEIDA